MRSERIDHSPALAFRSPVKRTSSAPALDISLHERLRHFVHINGSTTPCLGHQVIINIKTLPLILSRWCGCGCSLRLPYFLSSRRAFCPFGSGPATSGSAARVVWSFHFFSPRSSRIWLSYSFCCLFHSVSFGCSMAKPSVYSDLQLLPCSAWLVVSEICTETSAVVPLATDIVNSILPCESVFALVSRIF